MEYRYIRPENAEANGADVSTAILTDHSHEELATKFVVRDMSTSLYYVFDSVDDYDEFVEDLDTLHFEEVIFGQMHQRFKFDIDINDPIDNADAMIADFIDQLRTCFDVVYHIDVTNEIVVCTSHSKQKQSYHIVIRSPAAPSAKEAAMFTQELISGYLIDSEIIPYLDAGVNKSTQNFRLVGCCKPGTKRIKKLRDADRFTNRDSYINIAAVCESYEITEPLLSNNNPQQQAIYSSDNITMRVADYVKAIALANGSYAMPRSTSPPGLLIYNRDKPAHCELCGRTHDKDHTFMVQYYKNDNGMLQVAWRCRRSPGSRFVGTYNIDDIKYEPSDYIVNRPVISHSSYTEKIAKQNVYDEPELRPFELCDTLYVKAAMKMGKTKAMLKYIDTHFKADPIIRYLSFRQTFSANIKEKFAGFTLYSDVSGRLNQDKLIVQIESLHRIDIRPGVQAPDLLIMDESESIIEQFDSGLARNLNVSFPTFKWLVQNSKHVVCMDANMTDRTYNVISAMRGKVGEVLHWNKHQNCTDYKHFTTFNRNEWLAALSEKLGGGAKVAVASNSLEVAKTLYAMLSKYQLRVKLYSSATSASEKKLHFANVNKFWKEYDVVIYTPTVTAGVSFEEKHFDYVFVYASDLSCSVETLTQMIGRIRNVGKREIYTCFNASFRNYPVTGDEVMKALKMRRELLFKSDHMLAFDYTAAGDIVFYKTDYLNIYVENTIVKNLSLNNYVGRYNSIVGETGAMVAKLEFLDYDSVAALASEYKQCASQSKAADHRVVAQARDITIEESNAIYDKLQNEENVTEEEYNAYQKHKLRSQYNFAGEITEQFVSVYNNKSARVVYRNLVKLKQTGDDIDKMLCAIKATEQTSYVNAVNSGAVDDINRYYSYPYHAAAAFLMKLAGLSLKSSDYVSEAMIIGAVRGKQAAFVNAVNTVIVAQKTKLLVESALNVLDSEEYTRVVLKHISTVLNIMYGARIHRDSTGKPKTYSGICRLVGTSLFDVTADQPSLLAEPLSKRSGGERGMAKAIVDPADVGMPGDLIDDKDHTFD